MDPQKRTLVRQSCDAGLLFLDQFQQSFDQRAEVPRLS
jgi:hypothetical protein